MPHRQLGNSQETDRNSFFFKFQRDVDGDRVTVSANWIIRQSVWSLQCKMNGELLDATLSDDPWKDARGMIEAAFMSKEDLLPGVTATVTKATVDEPPLVDA